MAKAKTDIAKVDTEEDAERALAAAAEELGAFFDDPDFVDGLDDFETSDIKIGSILWNMRGKDKHGKTMTKDVFFDTVSEETRETIDVVMLTLKKTYKWDSFDQGLDKTIVHCQSNDRVTGVMEDGQRRPCLDCPDYGWFTDDEGKNVRRCGDVMNVVAEEQETQKPIMIRFKKTGLTPFQKHTSTHHKNARVHVDKKTKKKTRKNMPLFAYACRLSLKMSDNGMYSIPVLEPIEQSRTADGVPQYLLPTDDILSYAAVAKEWDSMANEAIAAADKREDSFVSTPDGESSNIDGNEFADD